MGFRETKQSTRPVTGLFFGSFNPIHNGHVGIARYLLENRLCDEVWFVVSPCNPFKVDRFLLPEAERLQIVEAAIGHDSRMKACDVEFTMPKPSYTVDTLRFLLDKHPGREFVLVMGADNVAAFPRWKDYHWIVMNCPIFVYPRSGESFPVQLPRGMSVIDAPLFPLSATEVREMILRGENISALVPAEAVPLVKQFYGKGNKK